MAPLVLLILPDPTAQEVPTVLPAPTLLMDHLAHTDLVALLLLMDLPAPLLLVALTDLQPLTVLAAHPDPTAQAPQLPPEVAMVAMAATAATAEPLVMAVALTVDLPAMVPPSADP